VTAAEPGEMCKTAAPAPVRSGAGVRLDVLALPVLLVIWLLCHPYFGNNRGSLIYTARALADLDPSGVGADAMFRLDQQAGFTVFTPILRWLTGMFGGSAAALGVAFVATLTFFAASATLAWRMAEDRTRYAIVVFMATLPSYYGGYRIFRYAEASASPRAFAEALVLFALAALLGRRNVLAIACMGAASLLHPIMALPGVALLLAWLVLEDRRWALFASALIVGGLAAAAIGVPPFDRIGATLDPEWRAILEERNPHLFPSLWIGGWRGRMFTQISILAIAASLVGPRLRTLFALVAAIGICGLAATYLLGERLSLLIVIQAQTWRAMWLVFAIGAAAAAICAVELARLDYKCRLALVFLCLALVFSDYDPVSIASSSAALALRFLLPDQDKLISRQGFRLAFGVAAALALFGLVRSQWITLTFLNYIPDDISDEMRRTLTVPTDYMPIAIVAGLWAAGGGVATRRAAIAAVVVLGALFAVSNWDRRTEESRFTDATPHLADLERIVASKPGEIYWVNGVRENWSWLGRPHWVSGIQGASIVFSRDLAVLYRERAQRAIAAGLADDEIVTPLTEPHLKELPGLDAEKVRAFCGAPDAPAWIVAPLRKDEHLAPEFRSIEWTAPVEKLEILDGDGKIDWRRHSRYAVIPCAQ
jgi:hypothetical protein